METATSMEVYLFNTILTSAPTEISLGRRIRRLLVLRLLPDIV